MRSKLVGVKDVIEILISYGTNGGLKREALLFDRIGFMDAKNGIRILADELPESHEYVARELEWLIERGIILDFERFSDVETRPWDEESAHYLKGAIVTSEGLERGGKKLDAELKKKGKFNKSELSAHFALAALHRQFSLRLASMLLMAKHDFVACPSLSGSLPEFEFHKSEPDRAVGIVLKALPIPDDTVPWEHVLEFRSDPDSAGRFLALRNWMSEMARSNLSASEIEEKLEWMIYDYKKHLELHKLKTTTGRTEAIVTAGSEFLEDLTNKRFSNLAKRLFTIKKRKIALLEAELAAPNREVAYIVHARSALGKK